MASAANSRGARDLTSILKSGDLIITRERVLGIFRTDCADLKPLTLELQNNSALTLGACRCSGQELETTNLIEKSARFRHEIFV
jgi:hypothetical protein